MSHTYDITLVTKADYVNPINPNTYVNNILLEDNLVMSALKAQGLNVHRVSWDDAAFDWSSTASVLIRATWDYFERIDAFRVWLHNTTKLTRFINPYPLLLWNMDKHYLQTLSGHGVAIAPTRFINQGELQTLSSLFRETGFREVVIKPAIGGGGYHTYRIRADQIDMYESIFADLIKQESLLFQQFQSSVLSFGEISLMFFAGHYSHAIRKQAKKGEFRVQDDFGGTVTAYEADMATIALAKNILSLCQPIPHYARVDLIADGADSWYLSELELIEPELWFRFKPDSASRFAEHLTSLTCAV
jgi:glutathione synthase/RimK-type ligase-like ATP-grasp enzyme